MSSEQGEIAPLQSAEAQWQASKSNHSKYKFIYHLGCMCRPPTRFEVTVDIASGEIESAYAMTDYDDSRVAVENVQGVYTIEEMFDDIREAILSADTNSDAKYNKLGYPDEFGSSPTNESIADGSIFVTIESFEFL